MLGFAAVVVRAEEKRAWTASSGIVDVLAMKMMVEVLDARSHCTCADCRS